MKDEPKRPVVAECECGHQCVAYLPMELKKFCRITGRAHCPYVWQRERQDRRPRRRIDLACKKVLWRMRGAQP